MDVAVVHAVVGSRMLLLIAMYCLNPSLYGGIVPYWEVARGRDCCSQAVGRSTSLMGGPGGQGGKRLVGADPLNEVSKYGA